MTIHHDKMAYGKLVASREDISEDRLLEMLEELTSYDEADSEDAEEKEEENCLGNKVKR